MCGYPYSPDKVLDMSETMNNSVKPAVQYVNKGLRRWRAEKALADSIQDPEDAGAVAVTEPPWKQSKRQGLEEARFLHWFLRI